MSGIPFWGSEPQLFDTILIGPALFQYQALYEATVVAQNDAATSRFDTATHYQ
jgi:hypothetical protein